MKEETVKAFKATEAFFNNLFKIKKWLSFLSC